MMLSTRWGLAGSLLLFLTIGACGGAESTTAPGGAGGGGAGGVGGAGDPCLSSLAEECGKSCTADKDCSTRTFCGTSKQCTAECTASARECAAGESCNRGRCVPGGLLGGAAGEAGAAGAAGGSSCVDFDLELVKQTPTVLLLVDRSGSMNADFGDSNRWNQVREALIGADGAVTALQGEVRFGLSLYTGDQGTGNGNREPTDGVCPKLVTVAPKLSNLTAFSPVYLEDDWVEGGETPTGESVTEAVKVLQAVKEPGDKLLILATDGEPDSCATPNPNTDGQRKTARDGVVAAVEAAFTAGIRTVPMFVGSPSGTAASHLGVVALAGAGKDTGGTGAQCTGQSTEACYFVATDPASLTSALERTIRNIRSCTFDMNGEVKAGEEKSGTVKFNGAPLTFPTDWKLDSTRRKLTILGANCDKLLDPAQKPTLTASFPCGTVTEIPIIK